MLLHATCIAFEGQAVLIAGPPGSGKSDLALRLIDQGAILVADDQTLLRAEGVKVLASAPGAIEGLLEIRHYGLIRMPHAQAQPVALYVELTPKAQALDRLPAAETLYLLDRPVQQLRLPAFAASTPAKIRAALLYPLVTDSA
ncbi:MAG: HPr kinase/phosphatase C-terminal domain-containing protein [Pseudomonadota bacterium]|nr:HPr kinase/phosphatase C-terminal domain-containing protein [Pseudomonadota bacterium]